MPVTEHKCYCERCGAELLPADPAPLCVTCWISDTSVYAPSLLITNDSTWNGTTPSRPAAPHASGGWGLSFPDRAIGISHTPDRKRIRRTRRTILALAMVTVVAFMLAIVPVAMSDTTPGPVHLGVQQTDKGTDACLANLYILNADKVAHRDSPADIVCPVTGKPYIYTQYEGITTIACPDAAAHNHTRIYIRTDVGVPVVN